jgi:hypothetical protein
LTVHERTLIQLHPWFGRETKTAKNSSNTSICAPQNSKTLRNRKPNPSNHPPEYETRTNSKRIRPAHRNFPIISPPKSTNHRYSARPPNPHRIDAEAHLDGHKPKQPHAPAAGLGPGVHVPRSPQPPTAPIHAPAAAAAAGLRLIARGRPPQLRLPSLRGWGTGPPLRAQKRRRARWPTAHVNATNAASPRRLAAEWIEARGAAPWGLGFGAAAGSSATRRGGEEEEASRGTGGARVVVWI